MKLSLAARTSLITALLLTVCVAVAGAVLYSRVRHGLREELEAQASGQVGVLQSLLEFDDGRIQLNGMQPKLLTQNQWRITTLNDQTLWSFNWVPGGESIAKERSFVLGEAEAPLVDPRELKKVRADEEDRVEHDAWQLPNEHSSIKLKIAVRVSRAHMDSDLNQLALALWTIGPLTVVFSAVLMALFLRWQLRPLNAMAREAALIGPENSAARISPAGSALECVQLRGAINRMLERLESGLQRERNFAAIAAHELRSPLAQMHTTMEVALRRNRDNAEYRQTINDCLGDVKRLEALASNLLTITRGFESIDCQVAVADLRSIIERARRECNSELNFDPAAATGVSVRGREELLAGALRNVLENAARYAPGLPAIVEIKQDASAVHVIVQDDGPGVPEGERERIFDPLIRLDSARTIRDETHGFGLGLTVARAAVRACGGDLVCRARSDGKTGAEFVFSFQPAHLGTNVEKSRGAGKPASVQ